MRLKYLELKNFSNYCRLKLDFSEQVNIFFGENAQGKTNLLEAIALLCIGKPFRAKKETEVIQWGMEHSFCKGIFGEDDYQIQIEIGIGHNEKRIKIDGQIVKKDAVFGKIPVVIFGPDDLQLVKGGPQQRRDFIDLYLAQIEPKYRFIYYNYYKTLKQRNRLLKQEFINKEELEIWDEQLIEKGTKVIVYRNALIEDVKPYIITAHQSISGSKEEINLEYISFNKQTIGNDEAEIKRIFKEELRNQKQQELQRGLTLVGPHRDDLLLTIEPRAELKIFGSQGQQRTAALSLKLGLVEKIRESRGMYPLIILDDVMSEFDDHRKQQLLKMLLNSAQTFLTSTSKRDFPFEASQTSFFAVDRGEVHYVAN